MNNLSTIEENADLDLFVESPASYLALGVPLYRAALEGDWNTADKILQEYPHLARARITKCKETALHIAAAAKRNDFVRKLLVFMREEDLALKNVRDNTALCFAAAAGNVEIAQLMVEKNEGLPLIRGNDSMTPLYMATLLGQRKMVEYLLEVTDCDELKPFELFDLLCTAIKSEFYDIAMAVFDSYPQLAQHKNSSNKTALHFLSQKRLETESDDVGLWSKWTAFWVQGRRSFRDRQRNYQTHGEGLELVEKLWEKIIGKTYDEITNIFGSPSVLLFDAAEIGNVEFIAILIYSYPDLIWKINPDGITMFHIAISNRQTEVFNLIYEIGAIKDLLATYTDKKNNNMLHFAAMKPPRASLNGILGAALLMQRELLWYKEVQSVVPYQFIESKNDDGMTPWALFIEDHESLRKEGEDWMKTTANSCSVVAALIATIAFTAAFTVPGGNGQDGDHKGVPIFQKNRTFVVFAVADAISLSSSSMAIFMFLGILTSRYSHEDFLESLPRRMITGLFSLFLSISSMMVAFAATFFLIFMAGDWLTAIPIMVTILVCLPVMFFAYQQSPLLVDIYRSTYKARYMFNPKNHRIFIAFQD